MVTQPADCQSIGMGGVDEAGLGRGAVGGHSMAKQRDRMVGITWRIDGAVIINTTPSGGVSIGLSRVLATASVAK